MDDDALDAAVLRHCRQFREGIAARSLRVIDHASGDPLPAGQVRASVTRLLAAGWLRWKNPAVRNRVLSTRPAPARDDKPEGCTLW